jgi:hypothetical protein
MTARRGNLCRIQASGNRTKAGGTAGLLLRDHWHALNTATLHLFHVCLARCGSDLCEPLSRNPTTAELLTASLGRGQGCFGAL